MVCYCLKLIQVISCLSGLASFYDLGFVPFQPCASTNVWLEFKLLSADLRDFSLTWMLDVSVCPLITYETLWPFWVFPCSFLWAEALMTVLLLWFRSGWGDHSEAGRGRHSPVLGFCRCSHWAAGVEQTWADRLRVVLQRAALLWKISASVLQRPGEAERPGDEEWRRFSDSEGSHLQWCGQIWVFCRNEENKRQAELHQCQGGTDY